MSFMSVPNDKGDNEMIPGLRIDLLAFALQLRKTSATRLSDEGVLRPVIASNGVPYLEMRSIGRQTKSVWVKERKKERAGIKVPYIRLHTYEILL